MGIFGRLPYNRRMARDQQLILNRYRPVGEAKAGGFGTVRVAWDTRIQRRVAIKCIELDEMDAARAALPGANAVRQQPREPLPWEDDPLFGEDDVADGAGENGATSVFDLIGDEPLVHSLAHVPGLDEARTAAMLSDASIVAVYDFEVQDSTAYLIMEYVEGMTLTDLLHRHADRLTLDVAAAVFASVSHALEVAHANQVLHLDIKPDNVLINHQGQVKVTDFGLATLADASGYGAAGGGTIGYMPLEQMRQENLDVRCDEWALASLTYEMLAGENPFLAPDLERAEAVIEDAELVLPSLCWDGLDPAIDDVIFFALDPDREERYATVADFAEELEPFLGDPKRGVRELSVIVGHADDEEEEAEAEKEPPTPRVPLRERITPLQRTVAAHAVGALGSGAVAFVAFTNLPQTSGFANPLFWGLFALVTLAGALKPHLGALLAYFALSATLVAGNAPAAGIVLLAAAATWWYFTGRLSNADANATLVPPLAGAFGCNQLTPLVAGFCLPPARAFGALAFSLLVSLMLAACGSHSLLGWDALANWQFSAGLDMQADLGSLLMQPALWCIVISWIAATGALSAFRLRPTRAFAVLGTLVAGALLLAGIALAAWVASGQATWMPSLNNLVFTIVPIVVMLLMCVLVPEPYYYDEDYEGYAEEA
ncbi:serine/threonine protein kinase [Eggerthella guodeyinii]|uniref:non-specific serine/threonine protein kinase n=2 Tax=Eggerthella guodeyinii TaxID=2690837 RepID=A0A6L7IMY1_9ACTN|nr:serine/threonine protein kinase [Eggerthella guodeyinii]